MGSMGTRGCGRPACRRARRGNGGCECMVVVLSKFHVVGDMAGEGRHAFHERPHLVDDAPGFVRMEVLSPRDNPGEFWLWTYWADEESYRAWHRSHAYKQSQKGIPKGLKLIPRSAEIRVFEHVAD